MWMCRAVLPDGKVCETTNFDTAEQCLNCGAPRQANEPYEQHDELETLIGTAKHAAEIGREKLMQYAPVASAVAHSARDRASTLAMHSKLATHTGIHMAGVISFCIVLLASSIVLPVALGWPLTLTVTKRTDSNLAIGQADSTDAPAQAQAPPAAPDSDSSSSAPPDLPGNQTQLYQNTGDQAGQPEGGQGQLTQGNVDSGAANQAGGDNSQAQPQEFQGSIAESRHLYNGSERVIVFTPKKLTDPRKNEIQLAAFLAGPILVSGTPVTLYGKGDTSEGGQGKGNISLELTNSHIFWFSALALLILLLIADLLLGDIYAMQKVLFSLELVWILYSLILNWLAGNYMKGLTAQLFPDFSMDMTLSGLMTAPVKIAFIGLIYWMGSMLLRSLHEERTAAKAERRRKEARADA